MKKAEYEQYDDEYWWLKGRYGLKYGGWFRFFRTFNEVRQNHHAECDGHKVRGRRKNIPIIWDDRSYSQMYGRDWKRFTRRRHQWKG